METGSFANRYVTISKFYDAGETKIAGLFNRNARTLDNFGENKPSRIQKQLRKRASSKKIKGLFSLKQVRTETSESSAKKDLFPINRIEISSQGSSMSVSSQEIPCASEYFCQEKNSSLLKLSKAEAVQNCSNITGLRTIGDDNEISGFKGSFSELVSESVSNLSSLSNFCKSGQKSENANIVSSHKDSQNSVQSMETSSQESLSSQKMEISSSGSIIADNMNTLDLDKQNKSQLMERISKSLSIKTPFYKCTKRRKNIFWMKKWEMNAKRREVAVRKREIAVKKREIAIKKREVVLKEKEMALLKRELLLEHHETSIAEKKVSIISREKCLKAREQKILNYEAAIFSNI